MACLPGPRLGVLVEGGLERELLEAKEWERGTVCSLLHNAFSNNSSFFQLVVFELISID